MLPRFRGIRKMFSTETLTFSGQNAAECAVFIQAVRRRALVEGKAGDNAWMAHLAAASLSGAARRWYVDLGEDTRGNWILLERAMLLNFTGEAAANPSDSPFGPQASGSIPTPAAAPQAAPAVEPRLPSPSPDRGYTSSDDDFAIPGAFPRPPSSSSSVRSYGYSIAEESEVPPDSPVPEALEPFLNDDDDDDDLPPLPPPSASSLPSSPPPSRRPPRPPIVRNEKSAPAALLQSSVAPCDIQLEGRPAKDALFLAARIVGQGSVLLKRRYFRDSKNSQEYFIWSLKELQHPNILAFSQRVDVKGRLYCVTPYTVLDPMLSYLGRNPEVDKQLLLASVASAVCHLHKLGICHGSLRMESVLMSDGRPFLYNFGSSTIGSTGKLTEDVYDFGIFIAEALSATVYTAWNALLRRPPPIRPLSSPKGTSYLPLWKIAQQCWQSPNTRLDIVAVHNNITGNPAAAAVPEAASSNSKPTSAATSASVNSPPADARGMSLVPTSAPVAAPSTAVATPSKSSRDPNELGPTPARAATDSGDARKKGTSPVATQLPEKPEPSKKESYGCITWPGSPQGRFKKPEKPFVRSGYSEVWRCEMEYTDGTRKTVAVKELRMTGVMAEPSQVLEKERKTVRNLQREVRILMDLNHPNVAPLLAFSFDPEPCLISPWYGRGNLLQYLRQNTVCDRKALALGIVRGLEYIHGRSPPVIHGDLKPDNVVMDDDGTPRIIDFGLSQVSETLSSLAPTDPYAGHWRWMAPELLHDQPKSRNTDVYSFGCLALLIFTDEEPHKSIASFAGLAGAIAAKQPPVSDRTKYPRLPPTSTAWDTLDRCWDPTPTSRPTMAHIVSTIDGFQPGDLSHAASVPIQP